MPTPASQVELTIFEDQLGELILIDAPGAQISALSDQTPLPIGTESAGTANAASRADHIHRHGNQTGGSLHLGATSGAAGFMSSADKAKLDAATDVDTASTLVLRDSAGDFAANEITADLIGNVTGDLTGTASDIADNTVTSAKIVDGAIVDADVNAAASIAVSKLADGAARQLLQTDAAGTGVEWASNIDIPGTLDVTDNAIFDANVTVQGDLTVNGTETVINTQTLTVEDKNIELGKVDSPTDTTADGGGITLKGATDKTINWVDATDSWTSSENVDLANGKSYKVNNADVLTGSSLGSGVTSSSLTSVGTLTGGAIGTGFTTVATAQGGTGQTTYANGELLIGKTDGTLAKATLSGGTGIDITNADGAVTVDVDSTVVTTAQTGTVTSTMIADGTIVDADVNASAGIVDTKLATISTAGKVSNSATTATSANTNNAIVARDASGNFSAGTITADLAGNASTVTTNADLTGDVTSVGNATSIAAGVIVDADVNASAAIAGTKISPDFGSQSVLTTGGIDAGSLASLANLMLAFATRGASIGEPGKLLFGVGPAVTGTAPVGIGPHDYYPIDLATGSFM